MKENTNNLFDFGGAISSEYFIGREDEIKHLSANFKHGINTILISPRRWGKTSLVNHVTELLSDDKDFIFIYMDIFACKDEADFYSTFSSAVIKQTAGKTEKILDELKSLITRINPQFSFGSTGMPEYKLTLGLQPKAVDYESILNLPERIAQKCGKRMIVCIDEFQQIGEFPDSEAVQKKLRGIWQHQHNTSYCLFGSKRHMMMNIFQKKKMPFYQFGDVIHLQRIPTQQWVDYIQERFERGGKHIPEEQAIEICSIVDNFSSYVQQLAWLTYLKVEDGGTANEDSLQAGVRALLNSNEPQFMEQIEPLTAYQMNFLRAILDGHSKDFGKEEIRIGYNLGSYSNIGRLKESLIKKDLIDTEYKKIFIADPIFKLWLMEKLA